MRADDRVVRARRAGRRRWRRLRFAFAGMACAVVWLALALGASGESPAPSPEPAGEATPSPLASADPGPSGAGGLFESPEATSTAEAATAPPVPARALHGESGDANGCVDCHRAVNDEQAEITEQWTGSAHDLAGVSCADCHGGDPGSDQITVAMAPENGFQGSVDRLGAVGMCGSCHADVERMRTTGLATDQYAKYWSSVHGQRLLTAGDARVATCADCHGAHDVKKVSDPSARVFVLNVPDLCAGCHADAARMEPYGIPTDQFDVYSKSVHGTALLVNKDTRAPSCASCHGSHDAQPPTSATVVDVCGRCHTATQELYEESRHADLQTAAPKCWTCHGTHDVSRPGARLFFHPQPPEYTCTTCHDLSTRKLRIEVSRFATEADRRCDTCHHPDSQIYAQIQGIETAVSGAETAYEDAGTGIEEAARLGMITSDAEVVLAGARTSLIQAQAAVHTTKLKKVAELSADARAKAEQAQAMARAQIDESGFRRQAMVVVLALIGVCLGYLVLLKRRFDRELEIR